MKYESLVGGVLHRDNNFDFSFEKQYIKKIDEFYKKIIENDHMLCEPSYFQLFVYFKFNYLHP